LVAVEVADMMMHGYFFDIVVRESFVALQTDIADFLVKRYSTVATLVRLALVAVEVMVMVMVMVMMHHHGYLCPCSI
jgi:hypothetical protein